MHFISRAVVDDPENLGIHTEEEHLKLSPDVSALICQLVSRGSNVKVNRSIQLEVLDKRRPEIALVTRKSPNVTFSTLEVTPTLKCLAFGVPRPEIRWEKDGHLNSVSFINLVTVP
jgi:hypothetical protein